MTNTPATNHSQDTVIPDDQLDAAMAQAAPLEAEDTADTPDTEHVAGSDEKLVPVTESIRYRRRAQAAERERETLQARVNELTGALAESEQTIAALERRQRIDALLSDAEAIDLEAARLLTEAAVMQMDKPDVALAVADLRRQKPYLFALRHLGASAMGAEPDDPDPLDAAAEQAVTSGDRRDLLRYLRLRRTPA